MSAKMKWLGNDVIMTLSGEINVIELSELSDQIYGDVRFDNMSFQLIDFNQVTQFNLDTDDVEEVSELERGATRWNDAVKIGCVTTDPYIIKMINMYEKLMEGTNWSTQIFDTKEAALKWCLEK